MEDPWLLHIQFAYPLSKSTKMLLTCRVRDTLETLFLKHGELDMDDLWLLHVQFAYTTRHFVFRDVGYGRPMVITCTIRICLLDPMLPQGLCRRVFMCLVDPMVPWGLCHHVLMCLVDPMFPRGL
jgi:hypothetical protein